MKVSFAVLVTAFASAVYSQIIAREVAQIPSCALKCLTTAIVGGGCGLSDYDCQCGSAKASIDALSSPCLATACSATDVQKLQSISNSICQAHLAAGAPPSSPASVSFAEKVELRAEPTGSFIGGGGGGGGGGYHTTTTTAATTTTAPGVGGGAGGPGGPGVGGGYPTTTTTTSAPGAGVGGGAGGGGPGGYGPTSSSSSSSSSSTSSSASSSPSVVLSNPADRLHAGGLVGAAAALVALVL